MTKRPRMYCKSCQNDFWQKDDFGSILRYGKCQKCILEESIGHPYEPKTWDCECGKTFLTEQRFNQHQTNYQHGDKKYQTIEIK